MASKKILNARDVKIFGRDYVKILIIMLKKAGKRSSGALINSIDFRLKEQANQINIELIANDYLKYVDEGRRAGTYPPISAIAKWTSINGISKSAAFPIARSIFKFGIKPTHVLDKTSKEILSSPALDRKYEDSLRDNLEDLIYDEMIKKFN